MAGDGEGGESEGGRQSRVTYVPCRSSVKAFCHVVISFPVATKIKKFIPNILIVIVALTV